MIYLDMVFAVLFMVVMFYSVWVSLKTEGKESLLWIAAALVFCNEAMDIGDGVIKHYEEQPAVKEVRV